jgi:predicted kinase
MSANATPIARRPVLAVIRGKVGSGKSTLARGIERRLGFVRVDYDAEMLRSLRSYNPYGPPTAAVRDLSRQEGRIVAGRVARSILEERKSVACDVDLRDSRELSELTSYDKPLPANARLLIVRLEVSHDVARRRKVTPEWDEFRLNPRNALRAFEFLWSFPLLSLNGEKVVNVDPKSAEEVEEEACHLVSSTW